MPRSGLKVCDNCGKQSGVRAYQCKNCGSDFTVNTVQSYVLKMHEPKLFTAPPGVLIVHVPAGKCPVPFNKSWLATNIIQLNEWAAQVRRVKMAKEGLYLSNHALKLYLRDYFAPSDNVYQFACFLLDTYVKEEYS